MQLDRLIKGARNGDRAALSQYMRQLRRSQPLEDVIVAYVEMKGGLVELDWDGWHDMLRNVSSLSTLTASQEVGMAFDRVIGVGRLFRYSGQCTCVCNSRERLYESARDAQDSARAISALHRAHKHALEAVWAQDIGAEAAAMVMAAATYPANLDGGRDLSARKFPGVDYRGLIEKRWLRKGWPWHDAVKLAPTAPMPTWAQLAELA